MNLIFEINTRVWLKQLSTRHNRTITLLNVPEEEFRQMSRFGFDSVWLMGIWKASDKGKQIARNRDDLRQEFLKALPDHHPDDIVSSPYAVAGYEPDSLLGGEAGLIKFKDQLHKNGIKLILDFVPNHVAMDHPWVKDHPEYFINGTKQDVGDNPDIFFLTENKTVLAYGKDPYFPAWTDVVPLNYFNPQTRKAMQDVLLKIASLCDGVRCDMAMLILRRIQKQIWGQRVFAGSKLREPTTEFWQDAIAEVKKAHPDFFFIAEVYWGLESELVSLGFDYVYDKVFYDALKEMDVEGLRINLAEAGPSAKKRLRFIENHDEDRAAAVFGSEKSKAAFLMMMCASGVHLLHQGQMEGFFKKLPVQLIRMSKEETNRGLFLFYEHCLSNFKTMSEANSPWVLREILPAWEGNPSFRNLFTFSRASLYLAAINYSPSRSQGYVYLDLRGLKVKNVLLEDLLGSEQYLRSGDELASRGLYLDMPANGFHLFRITGVHSI